MYVCELTFSVGGGGDGDGDGMTAARHFPAVFVVTKSGILNQNMIFFPSVMFSHCIRRGLEICSFEIWIS